LTTFIDAPSTDTRGGTDSIYEPFATLFSQVRRPMKNLRHRLNELRERRGPEHLHAVLRPFLIRRARWNFILAIGPRVQRAIEVRLQTGELSVGKEE